jgi:hypothetical protein
MGDIIDDALQSAEKESTNYEAKYRQQVFITMLISIGATLLATSLLLQGVYRMGKRGDVELNVSNLTELLETGRVYVNDVTFKLDPESSRDAGQMEDLGDYALKMAKAATPQGYPIDIEVGIETFIHDQTYTDGNVTLRFHGDTMCDPEGLRRAGQRLIKMADDAQKEKQ